MQKHTSNIYANRELSPSDARKMILHVVGRSIQLMEKERELNVAEFI